MYILNFFIVLILLNLSNGLYNYDYYQKRLEILEEEAEKFIGHQLQLNRKEKLVNWTIVQLKDIELNTSLYDPASLFLPNMVEMASNMTNSPVYKMVRKLPKGGLLHLHLSAGVSIYSIINRIMSMNGFYMCKPMNEPLIFTWSPARPAGELGCHSWYTLAEKKFTITQIKQGVGIFYSGLPFKPNIWDSFERFFDVMKIILSYEPAFRKYFYLLLSEAYQDKISYMEIRSSYSLKLCVDLQCSRKLDQTDLIKIIYEMTEKFKKTHPYFCGVKLIYAPFRGVSTETFKRYLTTLYTLRQEFPDFVKGFDLVGEEVLAPLLRFVPYILEYKKKDPQIYFVFHGGETVWAGSPVDENLIDIVLLHSKRIGHGNAIIKHPYVQRKVVEKSIAIELCPISNKVLLVQGDLRNHPGSSYIRSGGFKVVIGSDDPTVWGTTLMSHDTYVAFMALGSFTSDLRMLKQLAYNSISHSLMSLREKFVCKIKFCQWWHHSINDLSRSRASR